MALSAGGFPVVTRLNRVAQNTLVFDGVTYGPVANSPITIFTISGQIRITALSIFCSTSLVGTSATIALGTAANTTGLIAATTATNLAANQFWQDTSPETDVSPVITNYNINRNIVLTIAVATITAGQLMFSMEWRPLSAGAQVS